MQLLIQRGQRFTTFLRRPLFQLWVKFELTPEETALVNQYNAGKMILIEGGLPGQFKLFLTLAAGGVFRLSLYLAIIPALVIYSFSNSLFAAFQFWLVGTFFIYSQIRERVKVLDVLIGRSFSCKSVVNLIAMEEEIANVANGFRHVLEAMKNWGGREIIELAPYQAPILRVIEKSHESA